MDLLYLAAASVFDPKLGQPTDQAKERTMRATKRIMPSVEAGRGQAVTASRRAFAFDGQVCSEF